MASNKPSAQTLERRAQIIKVLQQNPGMTALEVRLEVGKTMPITGSEVGNALTILRKYGDIRTEKEGLLNRYFVLDGALVVRTPVAKPPRFPDAAYSTMGWVVHQLQGVI